jgi:hypothetical protein
MRGAAIMSQGEQTWPSARSIPHACKVKLLIVGTAARPTRSSKNDKPPRHGSTMRFSAGPSRLGRRTKPTAGGVGINRPTEWPAIRSPDSFSWLPRLSERQRLESWIAPPAMGRFRCRCHSPFRFFQSARFSGIRPHRPRAGVLSLIEETRRNATSNAILTARYVAGYGPPATSQSVGEPPLSGTPIAAGPTAQSAPLTWKPKVVAGLEIPCR